MVQGSGFRVGVWGFTGSMVQDLSEPASREGEGPVVLICDSDKVCTRSPEVLVNEMRHVRLCASV
jgi:hypothetical protein